VPVAKEPTPGADDVVTDGTGEGPAMVLIGELNGAGERTIGELSSEFQVGSGMLE
jgi:hypothetical protein